MKRFYLSAFALAGLSACMTANPADHLVGQRGGENIYEFGVAYQGSQFAYEHQRDNYAAALCPQGYRFVDTRATEQVTVIGVRQATQTVVRIACPA